MERDLKAIFERAFDDEPAPPDDLAPHAMVSGARLRRRRRLLTGTGATGLAAIIAAFLFVSQLPAPTAPAHALPRQAGPDVVLAAFMQLETGCSQPNGRPPTKVSIFLALDATAQQRDDVGAALRSDQLLRDVTFENHEQAYARFKDLWEGKGPAYAKFQELWRPSPSPDLVRAVKPDQVPESFRARFTASSGYDRLDAALRRLPGVQDVFAEYCPAGGRAGEGR